MIGTIDTGWAVLLAVYAVCITTYVVLLWQAAFRFVRAWPQPTKVQGERLQFAGVWLGVLVCWLVVMVIERGN